MSSLHNPEKLLFDIYSAAKSIRDFSKGLDKNSFQKNEMVVSACERKFEIIGEAFNRLKKKFPEIAKDFPELEKIIGFRNVIIHGYDIVDAEIVWDTIQNDLPALISRVELKVQE